MDGSAANQMRKCRIACQSSERPKYTPKDGVRTKAIITELFQDYKEGRLVA